MYDEVMSCEVRDGYGQSRVEVECGCMVCGSDNE